jgi:hypothetical protein
VDEEGHHKVVFDDIVDHKGTNKAMDKSEDDLYVTVNRRKHGNYVSYGKTAPLALAGSHYQT